MAMDKDRLGNKLADAVLTFLPSAPIAADETKLRDLMKVIADEIIKEFTGFAEIESDGATETHGAGAAADIVDLPGVISA